MAPTFSFLRFFAGSRGLRRLVTGGLCFWLAACSSSPPAPKEQAADLRIQVIASENINPDDKGRPAPIMVRVYELKSATAFRSADYFTLQDDDRKATGDDVLVVDEFILRPGDTKEISRKANASTNAIGVLAGYRNLGKSVWRDVYQLRQPQKAPWYRRMFTRERKETLTVNVDKQAVSISARRGDKWIFQTGSRG
ncbi:type VI secretion system protein VasD [Paraburkholderia caballeronis]|uniref:Type VI secretion system protein VasD n=1 Tax=Paraburkholderia caballeronis TaxID=416943 RepID=A0A1H7FLG6_9BURK|nr:type VI secretion system protein VasD [Paraburkholderia caballeronis]PXX00668.1 type VI secretion system protein VasD [Paraburkholderia caballeronis]RAJ98731.1 type VI secretion system protein VasD [Paraburkholderia caballeronis]SEE71228.1 type VI secretion system protein VasD [Paraburkholderia caballeronis]SEK26644.1 type VI secretion system protein VasD [Paraburkholderia caballeronis]